MPIITVEESQFCRELCEILAPFEKMTSSISVEKYMSGSSVIVISKCLHVKLEIIFTSMIVFNFHFFNNLQYSNIVTYAV